MTLQTYIFRATEPNLDTRKAIIRRFKESVGELADHLSINNIYYLSCQGGGFLGEENTSIVGSRVVTVAIKGAVYVLSEDWTGSLDPNREYNVVLCGREGSELTALADAIAQRNPRLRLLNPNSMEARA